jgi:glycosyltransferase involved in cell wall biosynthesis
MWRRRIVLYFHAGGLPEVLAKRPQPACWLYRQADRAACPSTYLRDALGRYGLELEVIPNGLDIRPYPYRWRSSVGPNLLWLRTFHPFYNPQLALEAFARVRERLAEARLTMAGIDRGSAAEIKRLADDRGLPVNFLGQIAKADIPKVMAEHDIYLNTPHVDNMPVTVIEALLCGLPVVATRVGGIPHILDDGETALLVPDDDPEAMAAAVVRLVSDAELASRLSEQGRRLAETWSWENVIPRWVELITGSERPQLSRAAL